MTLIASYGGNGSNSYIDATQATSFNKSATLSFDAWTSLSGAQKQAALQMATRDIESFTYSGFRYFSDQTLKFPRQFQSRFPFNRTTSATLGQDITQARMQDDVSKATALQALKIAVDGGSDPDAARISAGVSSWTESVGPIKESVQYGKVSQRSSNRSRMDPQAFALLQEWLTTRRIWRS